MPFPYSNRVRSASSATHQSLDDPLTRALQPSLNESPVERLERIRAEKEAKIISDEIDEELRKEMKRREKNKGKLVRVLLLGQSESGKSTTLKNFQIHYAPLAWREERLAWRAVIQLNLIRSVALVLKAIASFPEKSLIKVEMQSGPETPTPVIATTTPADLLARYTPLLARLQVAEHILRNQLCPEEGQQEGDYRSFLAHSPPPSASPLTAVTPSSFKPREFFVRTSWKSRFMRRRTSSATTSSEPFVLPGRGSPAHGQQQNQRPNKSSTEIQTSHTHERSTPALWNGLGSRQNQHNKASQKLRSSLDFQGSGSKEDRRTSEEYSRNANGKERDSGVYNSRKRSLTLNTNFSTISPSSEDQFAGLATATEARIPPIELAQVSLPSVDSSEVSQQPLLGSPPSPTEILHSSILEMKALWDDPAVKKIVGQRRDGISPVDEDNDLSPQEARESKNGAGVDGAEVPAGPSISESLTQDPTGNRPQKGSFTSNANIGDYASLIARLDAELGTIIQSGTRLEDVPGFFLPDAERIAAKDYEPSDNDVVHARLRTMGVQEHRFTFEKGIDQGREWLVIDIGGSRTQRSSWLSFFDQMDAIIFLAPLSCFDEVLIENPRVNRLADSINLWQTLCRSPLLTRVQLILFLNKIDILRRKIDDGVRVAKYVTSFGNRPNDVDTVCRYFKNKFRDIQRQYSPELRPYYVHLTSVIDTEATGVTLGIVREGILRANLQKADFI